MTREQALRTGERISSLWPTIKQEQLDIAVGTLLGDQFDEARTNEAIATLYLENSKFFLLSRLSELVAGTKPQEKSRGQIAAEQAYERTQRMLDRDRQMTIEPEAYRKAQAYLDQLPKPAVEELWLEFMRGLKGQPVGKMFQRMHDAGKNVASFVDWVARQATV